MKTPIEMILVDELGNQIDDVALIELLVIKNQRYAVLRLEDGISFNKLFINEDGITGLQDIDNEEEFKLVETIYYSNR